MGYPMSWQRLRNRNALWGSYRPTDPVIDPTVHPGSIAGDSERLETDTIDERHLHVYAQLAGVTEEQVGRIFRAFFHLPEPDCGKCAEGVERYPDNPNQRRCVFHGQWRFAP